MLPAPARAAITPLAQVPDRSPSIALAGDTAWFARQGDFMRVFERPADGSAPAVERLRVRGYGFMGLAGSAQRVAVNAIVEDPSTDEGRAQLYTGPPAGPLAPSGPPDLYNGDSIWLPNGPLVVDGARVFLGLSRGYPDRVRLRLREGPGAPVQFATAAEDQVAGDLEAVRDGRAIKLRNWVTGASLATVAPPWSIGSFDLAADGSLVADRSPHGGIYLVSPGGAVRRISKTGFVPELAGDRIVYYDHGGLMVAGPGRPPRRFGIRSPAFVGDYVTSGTRVAWIENHCLLSAPVDEPPASAIPPGQCVRTEIVPGVENQQRVHADRRVRFEVRCAGAPGGTCRGRARLGRGRPRPFAIRAGTNARLTLRATRAEYAKARHSYGVTLNIYVTTVDPGGRLGRTRIFTTLVR